MKHTTEEFVVGKDGIGYVSQGFKDRFYGKSFEECAVPSTSQTLPRDMTDAQIENELKPEFCTIGDVLAVITSGEEKYKDGYANLFYFGGCVVYVGWYSGEWYVSTWGRDGDGWDAGHRVFSRATDHLGARDIVHSNTVTLPTSLPDELTINGEMYRKVQ